jgi:ATP-dependent exoDNAse (exonuclease V) alpha subunit
LVDKTDLLEALKHSNVFLTGGAGVGKSYITNQIISHYKQQAKGVVALGSTGVSAVNIGGFTIHSFFVFGISNNFDELIQNDKYNKKRLSELKKILKATDLIIIDEISMVSANMLDMIYYRLSNYGFLGKILVVGDFYQLPPVQKNRQSNDIFGNKLYAFESDAWAKFDFYTIELTKMQRTSDEHFTHILSKVRKGICDKEVLEYMHTLWNNNLIEPNPTYLYGRNIDVEQTNRAKLNQLPSEETILFASIEENGVIPPKKLQSWKSMLPISEQLTLKVGAPVLFTVNKWGKFVNGERGILHEIQEDYLIVEKPNEYVRVERHDFDLLDIAVDDDGKVSTTTLATLSQYPIKLAYAITIHKSQGMSIDNLVCNVNHIFAPSQFYVAISRAINPKNLKIDFDRGDLLSYLQRIIHIDSRVVEFMG